MQVKKSYAEKPEAEDVLVPTDELEEPTSPYFPSNGYPPEPEDDAAHWVKNYERAKFRLSSLLPPVAWVPAYVRINLGKGTAADAAFMGPLQYSFRGDLISGLTVGFMLVPQCLAFALLAGLPVQVGLYSSFAPLVVYAALGTIRQVQPGPTALMSLLTGQALDQLGWEDEAQRMQGAALLALVVGGISVALGIIRFGFIVDFMSHSVMAAFCSAAGVTIATSQLKHMLGISMGRKKHWWETAFHLVTHLGETDLPTFALGGTLLLLLMMLKYWKSAGGEQKRRKHLVWRWFPKKKGSAPFQALRCIADLSSLLSVLLGWLWGLVYRLMAVDSVQFVGEVQGGGFKFVVPGEGLNAGMVGDVFMSAAVMAVVGFLETMAVGGKFAMQARYEYDPNQELLALGVSNVVGAAMSAYPTTGSFSRTAVNAMFGATSLVACAISSLLVLLAVLFLLPIVALLPMASLAPIIIQGAIGVINLHDFVVAFKSGRAEFVVMLATFIVSLALTVKEGLLVGFVLSVMKTMHDLANPNLAVCGRLRDGSFRDIRNFPSAELLPNAVVVRMDARLSFANARKMKEFCNRTAQVRERGGDRIDFVVIDGKSINHVDLTGCETLEMLAEDLSARGQRLIVANLKGPVSKCLSTAGVPDAISRSGGHLCIDMDQAVHIINGGDPEKAQMGVKELVRRVNTANRVMKDQSAAFYSCGSPAPAVKATATAGAVAKEAGGSPKRPHGVEEIWGPPWTTAEGEVCPEDVEFAAGVDGD